MSRRHDVFRYYRTPKSQRLASPLLNALQKSAASQTHVFTSEKIEFSLVVRLDLNAYSTWALGKPLSLRRDLLDDFFSFVVSRLGVKKGVYFRDEGDCLIAIFSNYFNLGASFSDVREFCKEVVSKTYGQGKLSAKATLSAGDVAYFQKAHEIGTDEWSAEGQPFVRAVRLEAAVDSKPCVYFFKDDYVSYFTASAPAAASGGAPATWIRDDDASVQVVGLNAAGGWVDIVKLEYKGPTN